MTTSFPASKDTFSNPAANDPTNSPTVPHHSQHDNANDAILAVEDVLLNGTSYPLGLVKRTDQPGGDVTGTAGGPLTVAKIQGNAVASTAPTDTQVLSWSTANSRWQPTSSVSTAAPASSVTGPDAYGAAAVVGTSISYARQDHDHGLPALDATNSDITTSAVGDAAAAGAVGKAADAGHKHGREAFAVPSAIGQSNTTGSAGTINHSDHVHQGVTSLTGGTGISVTGGDGSGHGAITAAVTTAIALVQENVNTVAASGTAQTIPDVTSDTINEITLTGNCTFTFPTGAAGKSFTLILIQDGTGSRTATWPGTVDWGTPGAPTLTTTANKADSFSFIYSGALSKWLGYTTGQAF